MMKWHFILLMLITTNTSAIPPRRSLGASVVPTCFPTRPYCIRPRAEECRDAIFLMASTDTEHPVIFGRPDVIKDTPRAYAVPQKWGSVPENCIVKIDVTDPRATEEVRMRSLAALAEVVVRKCVLGGTGCGGSASVGSVRSALELTLGYYTAVDIEGRSMDEAM